jgi:Amt family ammonium transporter
MINPAGANGMFFGNPSQFFIQALAILAVALYSFIVSLLILKGIDMVMGLRTSEEDEVNGLDLSQHGESGYTF